jgi:hypothetical protein
MLLITCTVIEVIPLNVRISRYLSVGDLIPFTTMFYIKILCMACELLFWDVALLI